MLILKSPRPSISEEEEEERDSVIIRMSGWRGWSTPLIRDSLRSRIGGSLHVQFKGKSGGKSEGGAEERGKRMEMEEQGRGVGGGRKGSRWSRKGGRGKEGDEIEWEPSYERNHKVVSVPITVACHGAFISSHVITQNAHCTITILDNTGFLILEDDTPQSKPPPPTV